MSADSESDIPPISPCIGICLIDGRTGWCRGCRRTVEEVAAWYEATPAEKRAILARTVERERLAAGPAAGSAGS